MKAILRRELVAYFTSPIVYVYLAIFTFFSGLFFTVGCLSAKTTNMASVYDSMFVVFLVIIPILTMRLFSEEKKQRTDQGLLTAPVSITGIVMGKFLAATVVFCCGMLVFFVYALMLAAHSAVQWQLVFCYTIGMMLLGMAFISIGIFVSSLTESQIISAIGSFVFMMVIYLINSIAQLAGSAISGRAGLWISDAIASLSFLTRFYEFTYGILSFSAVLFFISASAVMLFLTVKVIERRRYR